MCKLSLHFSGLFVEYMGQNERKYKRELGRRKKVLKILKRVHGLLVAAAERSKASDASFESMSSS